MKAWGTTATVWGLVSLLTGIVWAEADPIVIKGSKFFYKTNGTQFYIRGVAYQQEYAANTTTTKADTTYKDPLADVAACTRDIPFLQELQTNTIRVYAIDPTADHDQCMSMLADAGIYVIADLSAPVYGQSIIRDDPQWNDDLYFRYTSVVDVMAKYTNTLGFFAGNEVSNNNTNTNANAFVKAATRDMKAYIKQQNYRPIGVGYATNDDEAIRAGLADYFDCGEPADSIDFWGYNIYSWCGDSSYSESGYDERTKEFSDYNVPVFFAEYGCNEVQPRTFSEVGALYGDDMASVWSGGIVYMYFQEANDYGLVSLDGDSVSTLADFTNLASQLASVTPTGVNAADYAPTNTAARSCPSVGPDWQAASELPPTPNKELCTCMYSALSCVPNGVDENGVGELFGLVCGLSDGVCDGIAANATTGEYGAYGVCNATEQLGWALNVYYEQQRQSGNGASACDFSGSATTQSPVSPTGQCSALLRQAGNAGTGSVTSVPTGTAGSGSNSGSGSGSGSDSGSGSGNAATLAAGPPVLGSGILPLCLMLVLALTSGAGMIML